MSAKHTPGPWTAREGTTTGREVAGKTPRGKDYIIARCGGRDREANALLLAAAPDLLEALENVLGICETLFFLAHGKAGNPIVPDSKTKRRLDIARAAIAKAEGRS